MIKITEDEWQELLQNAGVIVLRRDTGERPAKSILLEAVNGFLFRKTK